MVFAYKDDTTSWLEIVMEIKGSGFGSGMLQPYPSFYLSLHKLYICIVTTL